VVVERPLRTKGIDPERAYTPKEIKALKTEHGVHADSPPVIRKIHKGGKADPLRGLFEATVKGRRCVVDYEPDTDLRDIEQVPLTEPGGIVAFIKREVLPHTSSATPHMQFAIQLTSPLANAVPPRPVRGTQ
jgi:type I restriction enzyme M protein